MPFGICTKPSKDDLTKEISLLVEIPDKSCIEVTLSRDALGLECLENVAKELGLEEAGNFGLCYKTKKGYEWWLVLEKPIKKQLEQHASTSNGTVNLKFKIHFFVAGSSWLRLQDKLTRNFYYLQLKGKILEGSLSCDKDTAVLLASYSAQAELGDYDAGRFESFMESQNLFPSDVTAIHSKDSLEKQSDIEIMADNDVNSCKPKEKHLELLALIRTLKRELKELEQKYAKAKSDHKVFSASHQ